MTPTPTLPQAPPIASEQRQKLETYLDLLLSVTQEMNLTAIVERDEAWEKHIEGTLQVLPYLGEGKRLLDVGSGGGLPGMVIAIMRPELSVTLLEATQKKARFLESTGKRLGLLNLTVACGRAEDEARLGSRRREFYDIVTARAVAPLRILLELTVPFLVPSGLLVAIKGERAETELAEAQNALSLLGTTLEASSRVPTATVLQLRKQRPTPAQFPRRAGEPKRRPL